MFSTSREEKKVLYKSNHVNGIEKKDEEERGTLESSQDVFAFKASIISTNLIINLIELLLKVHKQLN